MSQQSAIEWTDATWNPVTGCDRVSPGCKHCYALDLAARLKRMGQPRYQRDGRPPRSGPGFGVTLHEDKLEEPLRWRKPRMVFANSMSDLFHPEVPDEFILRVWTVMRRAEAHTFQVLTKRPERARDVLSRLAWRTPTTGEREDESLPSWRRSGWQAYLAIPDDLASAAQRSVVPPNIWLGTSIESRTYVGRADHLRATPAAVRFISAEPLLGSLVRYGSNVDGGRAATDLDLTGIDWLIVGGESGAKHRRMDPMWARDLRNAAQTKGTAFFFKQWGGRTPKAGGRELDGRTWDELPTSQEVT